jgi:hypothetical protein
MRVVLGLWIIAACGVGEIGTSEPLPDSPVAPGDSSIGGTGTLQVSITTTTKGGPYAPRNCAVVWIENAGGTIVKTIDRKCGMRSRHLVAWTAKSGGSGADTDAVTGASRQNHQTPLSICQRG